MNSYIHRLQYALQHIPRLLQLILVKNPSHYNQYLPGAEVGQSVLLNDVNSPFPRP